MLVRGFRTMLFELPFPTPEAFGKGGIGGGQSGAGATVDPAKAADASKKAELVAAFKMFDLNQDGYISAFELGQALSSMGETHSEQEILDLVRRTDANGDGKIDYKVCLI